MGLKKYRERHGLTQSEVVEEICKRALARGDAVVLGGVRSRPTAGSDRPRDDRSECRRTSLNDPVGYPRNHALYLIRLAEILAQRREIEESAAVAQQATVAAAGLESARITQGLHDLHQSVGARYP